MSKKLNLLFVGNQQLLTHNTLNLFAELDWQITPCTNSFQAIQEIKRNLNFNALLLEDNIGPLSPERLIDYLTTELNVSIPAILIFENDIPALNEGFLKLKKPLEKKHIQIINEYLCEHISSVVNNSKPYSLNYLKELSDNNTAFILESLSIFKNSVSDRLKDLEQALSLFKYKETREIAHNIKPSFEMLENDYCRSLCDDICYHAKDEGIANLLKELTGEYKKIIEELKKEFPQLN